MINFPIFEQLEVKDYGLFPGTDQKPGIDIHFKPGLTLILGANGLGKTTLITILFRMLTGGYDLPRTALDAAELGGSSLDIRQLNFQEKSLFSTRVQDLATNARGILRLSISKQQLTIHRNLKDLSLISVKFDGSEVICDEKEYQKKISSLSGIPSFGDWLLLLRHMVFYFEDRRELVWDRSAQRHIFRTMFLPPQEAQDWYRKEREILSRDTRYRNDSAALNRLKNRIIRNEKATGNKTSLRTELVSLRNLLEVDERAHSVLIEEADTLDTMRHELRRNLLSAEIGVDERARALEVEKLLLLKNYFPTDKQTAQHLYSLLIAQNHCAVCGKEAASTAEEFSTRIADLKCIVCGNNLTTATSSEKIIFLPKEKVKSLYDKLMEDKERVAALKSEMEEVSEKYYDVATRLIKVRADISERTKRIDQIEKVLPPDDEKQARDQSELTELRKTLDGDKVELLSLVTSFKNQINQANSRILNYSDAIKEAFANIASGFLAENVQLKWSPENKRLWQTATDKVDFPAFSLEMTGSNFTGPSLRNGPDAVSESQREFIDLAFRMALIHVAGESAGGSLVIDAPESSLDAFFVKRAANVLCRFGKSDTNNRLVITSNLVDGQLLPKMIKNGIPAEEKEVRLINLMDVAVPTAALRENRTEYQAELRKILASGGLNG